jgi:hypothetical protein
MQCAVVGKLGVLLDGHRGCCESRRHAFSGYSHSIVPGPGRDVQDHPVVSRTHVVRHLGSAASVVAHGHPRSAAPADGEALEQRGALAGGAGRALGAVRLALAPSSRSLISYCSKLM